MKIVRIAFSLILLELLFFSVSCTDETIPVNPVCVNGTDVHLSGKVRAWWCGVGNSWNNPIYDPDQLLFSIRTGEYADVKLIRDNGFESWFSTDDSSTFDRYISAGSYKAEITTGWTWPPDTLENLHFIPGDTEIVIDIVYDVNDPLHIIFGFIYPSFEDTTHMDQEIAVLKKLNTMAKEYDGRYIPAPLDFRETMDSIRTVSQVVEGGNVYVRYKMSIVREYQGYGKIWNVLQVCETISQAISADTTSVVPENMYFYPAGTYICLD